MRRTLLLLLLSLSILILSVASFVNNSRLHSGIPSQPPISIDPLPQKNSLITMGFVGDIMMHEPMRISGLDTVTGDYSFDHFFAPIQNELQKPDIMIGNLETPVAGDERGFSGFPNFNAPTAYLRALDTAGFDMLVLANNHSLDQRASGIIATRDHVRGHGIIPIGINATPNDHYQPTVLQHGDFTIAYITATFSFNGYELPGNQQYLINTLNTDRLLQGVAAAQQQNADIIIALLHFGDEYDRTQNESQEILAHALIDAGADAVIGSHPHVLQPIEQYSSQNGNTGIIAYSLGNFISNQQDMYTDLGGILQITFERDNTTDTTTILDHIFTPTWTDKTKRTNQKRYAVHPLAQAGSLPGISEMHRNRIQTYQSEQFYTDERGAK